MLLTNEENAKNETVKTATVLVPEEPSQEEVIRELEEANRGLAHQLADTRYKLNQVEIEYKRLNRVLKSCNESRNWVRSEYLELIDKILDRVNRND